MWQLAYCGLLTLVHALIRPVQELNLPVGMATFMWEDTTSTTERERPGQRTN